MVYSNCPFCGATERQRKNDCLANLKREAARVPELTSDNRKLLIVVQSQREQIATMKDELNRLALVHGAGVGIINSRGYERRRDLEKHDGGTL